MADKKTSPRKPSTKSKPRGDNYELSGDFRGAVVNIQSTIVSNDQIKELENLPPEPGESPYQGLQYFDEKDADRFFGRESLIAQVITRLAGTRFLAVIGASGSGKSSLVRAGMIPALRRGERLADGTLPPTDSGQWDIRILTPGAHPLDALAASLAKESESVTEAITLGADLAKEPRTLGLTTLRLLARTGRKHLLLVIDQFEEIFTQCNKNEERQAFIENLLTAVNLASPQSITILLILRADFYAQLSFHDGLREIASKNQEFIGAMNREELTRAILQPAALGNWKVQEGLVDVILDDLGSEPGALPLLSHALLETWKRRRGRALTVSGYKASGGVQGAISQTAETVFRQRLTAAQQPIARMIFIKLVEMGPDSPDSRRRASFSELITRATDTATIDVVLGILAESRLITTDIVGTANTRVVEVAHEALIHEWGTLRDWLNQNRAGLLLNRQLTEATDDWLKLGRDQGALFRGVRLAQTLEWAKTNGDLISLSEQEFLDASQKIDAQERNLVHRLANARWVQGLLAIAMLLVFLAFNGAFAPKVMPEGIFNVAVAKFGELAPDGQVQSSKTGSQISAWTVNYLKDELTKDEPNLLIWPDDSNVFARTSVPLVQPQTAETVALEINADLLVYGSIDTDARPPQLTLNFWIAPQDKYRFEDIQGAMQVGKPIRITDLNNPAASVQGDLGRQSRVIAWVAMGLRQEQLGQSRDALSAFLKAEEADPQSESDMLQFFIGREYLFLSQLEPDQRETHWLDAETAFQKSIALNDRYARAYVGLGGVYLARSATLTDAALKSGQPVDEQADQWLEKSMDAYQKVLDLKPDATQYGNPVEDVAKLALGNAYRLKGTIATIRRDDASALDDLGQALKFLEETRLSFEASTPEHESYRRYLAQAYEYLGEAYQWQGFVFEQMQDYQQALSAYEKSVGFYDQCIAQGDPDISSDLIIQTEIVQNRCQPYSVGARQKYDTLAGGQ
jgi:tetratricopeptide (TPR) repeat protein